MKELIEIKVGRKGVALGFFDSERKKVFYYCSWTATKPKIIDWKKIQSLGLKLTEDIKEVIKNVETARVDNKK